MSAPGRHAFDAVVVGSGPNGLAAAITLARAGLSVQVREGHEEVGGGLRTAELTQPGLLHDVCSAVHPLALASPFLAALPLHEHGLEWVHPDLPLVHPLDGGDAVALHRSLDATADALGRDGRAYRSLMAPLLQDWPRLMEDLLAPLRFPRRPLALAAFGARAAWPAAALARSRFRSERARALFAGLSAHSIQPLERPPSAAFGLLVGLLGHAVGWPWPRGGAAALARALASYLRSLGGEIVTGAPVTSLRELPSSRAVLLDVAPRGALQLAGELLPGWYRSALRRYRYGPGVFKLDLALDGPVPWRAAVARQAGTIHVGGTLAEIAASERTAWRGRPASRPFVLVAQQSLWDRSRTTPGREVLWAYCHAPHGSDADLREPLLAQVERFAPGFRERVVACRATTAAQLERYNPNYVGGDINAGVQGPLQHFLRPAYPIDPYSMPAEGLYLCSSSTPPGGGVHGMCGYHAARSALRRSFA